MFVGFNNLILFFFHMTYTFGMFKITIKKKIKYLITCELVSLQLLKVKNLFQYLIILLYLMFNFICILIFLYFKLYEPTKIILIHKKQNIYFLTII